MERLKEFIQQTKIVDAGDVGSLIESFDNLWNENELMNSYYNAGIRRDFYAAITQRLIDIKFYPHVHHKILVENLNGSESAELSNVTDMTEQEVKDYQDKYVGQLHPNNAVDFSRAKGADLKVLQDCVMRSRHYDEYLRFVQISPEADLVRFLRRLYLCNPQNDAKIDLRDDVRRQIKLIAVERGLVPHSYGRYDDYSK